MADTKTIYWVIAPENKNFSHHKCYAFLTTTSFTYEQFMAKENSAVHINYSTDDLFTYTREDGNRSVVINNEESLRIAIAYKGESAFDSKRGILIHRD